MVLRAVTHRRCGDPDATNPAPPSATSDTTDGVTAISGMRYLNEADRGALRLAERLQEAVQRWLDRSGVDPSFTISPFIDPRGQPAVIVQMDAHVASAMIDSLNEQHATPADQPSEQPSDQPSEWHPRLLPHGNATRS